MSSGENYQFDDVESSRLRLGLRYSCVLNKYSTLYLGGAWQYEFEGDSKTMYAGYNTLVPSLNGSSGMFEFGWQVKPSERSPLTLDFGAAGWFGRQKGASFRFSARWDL
ncbi:MAG: autotransporter domain-containing protein [Pyramidobacter sp.]